MVAAVAAEIAAAAAAMAAVVEESPVLGKVGTAEAGGLWSLTPLTLSMIYRLSKGGKKL
jgi:hypothetical protein